MSKTVFLVVVFVTLVGVMSARAAKDPTFVSDSGDWQGNSPNQKHFASLAVNRVDDRIWRTDMGMGMLEVVELKSGYVCESFHCFALGDRAGARAQWSPDSRYLIISTVSIGGHSPWHYDSYLYCADDCTLRYMDDVVGIVVAPAFRFVGPHTVRLGIAVAGPDFDFEHPKEIEFDLDQKWSAMKQMPLLKKGDM
jgi:hypothetical protein